MVTNLVSVSWLILLASTFKVALADPWAAACDAGISEAQNTVRIDAATGMVSGGIAFEKDDRVRIVLHNKNPARFTYRLQVEAKVMKEPDLAKVIQEYLAPVAAGLDPGQINNLIESHQPDQDAPNLIIDSPKSCGKIVDDAKQETESLMEEADTLALNLRGLAVKSSKLDARLAVHRKSLEQDDPGCSVLRDAMVKAVALLESDVETRELEEVRRKHELLAARVLVQRGEIKVLKSQGKLADGCLIVLQTMTAVLDGLKPKLTDIEKRRKALEARVAERRVLSTQLKKILSRPDAFFTQTTVGPFAERTEVSIVVYREAVSKDAKAEEWVSTRIRFGGRQKFTLASGIGISGIGVKSYVDSPSLRRDEDGDPIETDGEFTVGRIVALGEESSSSTFPTVVLHGRLWESDLLSPHLSLGFGARNNESELKPEYSFGLSVSAADDRLFFTIAAHRGWKRKLSGKFRLGDPLPEALAAVPTTLVGEWAPAILVSYAIGAP